MIKSNKGNVKIIGNGAEMLADFTTIAKSVGDCMMKVGVSKEFARFELKKCVERAFMSNEELREDMINDLIDTLTDLLEEESDEETPEESEEKEHE